MSQSPLHTPPTLSIVVPCFNEADGIKDTASRLMLKVRELQSQSLIAEDSLIYLIDDGSTDQTWKLIEILSTQNDTICGIKLTRNYGHQNALICGLLTARGDCIISIDADLQDDIDVIADMINQYRLGNDLVFGVRRHRNEDSIFKKITAEIFYRFMLTARADMIFNHADFRLLSRRAIEALSEYKEVNLYLRGLVCLIGFKSAIVEYDRSRRLTGTSKYTFRKMLSFAWQGITSFSIAPLRMITVLGLVVSFASICVTIWAFTVKLTTDAALPGWASTVIPIYFLGGVQLLSIGVIGEYIAKIYMESKARPRFHIEKIIENYSRHPKT